MNDDQIATERPGLEPGLYLIGTPIGNLEDIGPRAVEALRQVDLLFAEDTRHTRILLTRYGISRSVISCHKFNEASRKDLLLRTLSGGGSAGLVSNAGMPGVSDPGSRLAQACRREGFPSFVVPGPSAVTAAVALSGYGDRGFFFLGFLSHKTAARRKTLLELKDLRTALVLFESPHRLIKLLDDLEACLPGRRVFLARELTKRHEETLEGTPEDLKNAFADRSVRGEIVVVVAPPDRNRMSRDPLEKPSPEIDTPQAG